MSPNDTVPSISVITAGSLGWRASKSSATRGRPPVMSRVLYTSRLILAILSPGWTVAPLASSSWAPTGMMNSLATKPWSSPEATALPEEPFLPEAIALPEEPFLPEASALPGEPFLPEASALPEEPSASEASSWSESGSGPADHIWIRGWSFLSRSSMIAFCRRPVDSSYSSLTVCSSTMSRKTRTPCTSATIGSE